MAMEEKEKEMDPALFSAIEFAAKYRKGNEKKKSNTEKQYEEKINNVQQNIKKSKQLVVKHVIASRKLEHNLQQLTLTNQAIRSHVQEMPNKKFTSHHRKRLKNNLTDSELKQIDYVVGLSYGSSSNLQRSLRLFNDSQLTKELESFPLEQLHLLNEALFSKISWISSGKRISLSESYKIFDIGSTYTTILLRSNPNEPFDSLRWHVLKRMLRTRLRIIYLAEALAKYNHEKSLLVTKSSSLSSSTSISSSPSHSPTPSTLLRTQTSPETRLSNSHSSHHPHSHPHPHPHSHRHHRSANGDPTFSSTLPLLQKQLNLSKTKQLNHTKRIQSNISLISQTVALGSLQSAANYAKRVGIQKLTSVLYNKAHGYLRIVFEKLQLEVQASALESQVKDVQRLIGTHEMCSVLQRASHEKLERYLTIWKIKLENLKELEMYAAVVEIQRVGRGAIGRFQVRNRHRIAASRQLQRVVRGWLGRQRVVVLKYQRRLQWAVRVVEAAWRKQRWVRTMKNLFILRRQTLATQLLQRAYRGYHGRLEGKRRRLLKKQNYGALKLQCLWRRYEAIVLVDDYYRRWKEIEGAITIQALVRGRLGRNRVRRVRKWRDAACTIQRGVRCRLARDRVYHQRRFVAARMIQKHWRGYRTYKRVMKILVAKRKAREREDYAFNMIIKTVRGYWIRRKWGPKLREFKARRLEAMSRIKRRYKAVKQGNSVRRMIKHWNESALVITRALRKFQELCSDRARRRRLEYQSAVKIQSLVRGIKGREYAREVRRLLNQQGEMKLPIYYRLKKRYYCDQNAFNGWAAIRIQTVMRRVLATRFVMEVRWNHAARIIQQMVRKYLERKEAKEIVRQRKNALYYRDRMATRVQKIHRGNLGRKIAATHRSSDILKWFLRETKMCGLPKRCFINFRVRKRHMERMQLMVIKIQALARGYISRQRIRRIYKKLLKAREKRIFDKRARSATKIQGMYRQWKARKIVKKKRLEYEERERKRRQMEELDARLDDIHSSHLNDLLAVRVQQGIRGKLARNAKERQSTYVVEKLKDKELIRYTRAAIKIQATFRGYHGRLQFKEIQPQLQKALKARAFCVECEVNVATKRCRECKDQYCDKCYEILHRKGRRKTHGWELTRREGNQKNVGNNGGGSYGYENPNLWEEYWDENAQAKYWYHTITGEATWICPY